MTTAHAGYRSRQCRICDGVLEEFLHLGRQPISERFLRPADTADEYFYDLRVGRCTACEMVQLVDEVPREYMFHDAYPFHSSSSSAMAEHFRRVAVDLLDHELTGPDPFIVEIGCNDGIMLRTIADAGVRHLGFDPSSQVAGMAAAEGIQVRTEFFEESTARAARDSHGPADVVYAANTLCHIPYLDSVFRGIDALLAPGGVFVFEDPYLGDVREKRSFDQIYDEHFYLFSATSVQRLAAQYGFALVDVERLPVHGGELRYYLARAGSRRPRPAVAELLEEERARDLTGAETWQAFATEVAQIRQDLVRTLSELRAGGYRVAGYAATAKSATVTNYCGIGPELVPYVCDTTPAKQGRLTPGAHLPVRPPGAFSDPYPDFAVLFAWNHFDEIAAKEEEFRRRGGRWLLYVPEVHVA